MSERGPQVAQAEASLSLSEAKDGRTAVEMWLAVCRRSFPDFLRSVWTMEPPPGVGRKRYPVEWPYLQGLAQDLETWRLLSVLKARQLLVTWTLAAWIVWNMRFRPGTQVTVQSIGEKEASALVGRVRYVHENLPAWMRVVVGVDSQSEYEFPELGSKCLALPSTSDAARSSTGSIVIWDEADFHKNLDENYAAVKPTVDDNGGQVILVSTSNWRKVSGLFKQIARDPERYGYHEVVLPYDVRPGRDEAWWEARWKEVPESEGIDPHTYMTHEYMRNKMEALASPRGRAFFHVDAVERMMAAALDPMEVREGAVEVWKRPLVAGRYVLGGDVAWGETGAFSVLEVMDWQTGEQVAQFRARWPVERVAEMAVGLAREYNEAYALVERNGEGGEAVVAKMVELGYGRRMWWHDADARKPEKPGWQTDSGSRPVILTELREAVESGNIRVMSRKAVEEMSTFVWDEKGNVHHLEGAYDDCVMAMAIAWRARKVARFRLNGVAGARLPVGLY